MAEALEPTSRTASTYKRLKLTAVEGQFQLQLEGAEDVVLGSYRDWKVRVDDLVRDSRAALKDMLGAGQDRGDRTLGSLIDFGGGGGNFGPS